MNKEKIYDCINKKGLDHEDTILASQELDKEILSEMLKDPIVENIYLKQVIKAKDYRIEHLENILKGLIYEKRIYDIAKGTRIESEASGEAKDKTILIVTVAGDKGAGNEAEIDDFR